MRAPAGGDAPRWLPAAGIVLALGPAIWFTYLGIDWRNNGCGCGGGFMPGWSWVAVVVLAVACYVAAGALAWRWARRRL